jgi:hypothetical protein
MLRAAGGWRRNEGEQKVALNARTTYVCIHVQGKQAIKHLAETPPTLPIKVAKDRDRSVINMTEVDARETSMHEAPAKQVCYMD